MSLLTILGMILLFAVLFFPLRADANVRVNFLKLNANAELNIFGLNVDRFYITLKSLKNKRGRDIEYIKIPKFVLRIIYNLFKTCKISLTENFFVSAENDAFTSCMIGGSEVVIMSILNAQITRIKRMIIVKNYVKCDTGTDNVNLKLDAQIETNLFRMLISVICGLVYIKF